MEKVKLEKKAIKKDFKTVRITPLKDFKFVSNEFKYILKEGEETEVDKRFLENLKTENVIK